jgi:hypothetical protein
MRGEGKTAEALMASTRSRKCLRSFRRAEGLTLRHPTLQELRLVDRALPYTQAATTLAAHSRRHEGMHPADGRGGQQTEVPTRGG